MNQNQPLRVIERWPPEGVPVEPPEPPADYWQRMLWRQEESLRRLKAALVIAERRREAQQ